MILTATRPTSFLIDQLRCRSVYTNSERHFSGCCGLYRVYLNKRLCFAFRTFEHRGNGQLQSLKHKKQKWLIHAEFNQMFSFSSYLRFCHRTTKLSKTFPQSKSHNSPTQFFLDSYIKITSARFWTVFQIFTGIFWISPNFFEEIRI